MNEHHEEYNRGWYFPISLVRLYEAGTINAEEMMLLGKINSLCHPEKGCWASNQWLADWWGKTAHWVSRSIARFKDLELIVVKVSKKKGNHRSMWPTFQPDQLCKKKHIAIQEKAHSYVRKSTGQLTYTNDNNKRAHCGGSTSSTTGFLPTPTTQDPFLSKCVEKLETFIRKSRKISLNFKRHKWYNEFRMLLQSIDDDQPRLKHVLMTYIKTPHDDHTPQADSAESFRNKFLRIEDWMLRAQREEEGGVEFVRRPVLMEDGETVMVTEERTRSPGPVRLHREG